MAIQISTINGKKVYEVYVNGFDLRGRRIQRRKRSIETLRKAETIEFQLKCELAKLRNEAVPLKWAEWYEQCLRQMRIELAPSTIAGYESQIKKWIHPHWANRELQSISKSEVHELIFVECQEIKTQHTRKNVLKMVKRIFELAVEEGLLERNPCVGISVRTTEVDQKVLTSVEVEKFLTEARSLQHRFYPVWAMALFTGMRSGELFALKWTDIDLEARTISVSRSTQLSERTKT